MLNNYLASTVTTTKKQKKLNQILSILHSITSLARMREPTLPMQDIPTDQCLEAIWRWNSTVPETTERCIQDIFTEQIRARPNAPAICAWDGEMTYGKLDVLSTKLASHLVQLGVKPEDIVPLCFEKSMWTVVAMLAVLKAGGAFVPLDPDHPASRHEEIFRQTGTKVLLTSAQYSAAWTSSSYYAVTVSGASLSQLPVAVDAPSPLVKPENAAYIIFTSGSTGVPKGVVLEHTAVATSCLGHGRAFGITNLSRVLQFASYTFDACIAEIITTLLCGGCICVPSDSDRRNSLAKAISTMDVNWAFLTPSVARLLDPGLVPSLKILAIGGEQSSSADWNRWPGSVQKIHVYGPTECCIFCTGYTSKQGFEPSTIGTSVASVSWVVDPENHERLAPLGSMGELLVEGPILARGYLNDVNKTEAAFINDPAWLLEGYRGHAGRRGRLYKTGDLVRYDVNGNLVYLGRKDSQVKVRGQRVELGEIEHHVRECLPEARQLAVEVILPSGQKNHAMLAVFVQLGKGTHNAHLEEKAGGDNITAQVVFLTGTEEELAKRLPKHMVPTVFFALLHFPMTTSGKTDRKRLREIGASFTTQQLAETQTSSQGPKRQPSTEAEQTMQQLWARVLGIEPDSIGLDDSFFRLGGDSIAAMKLVGEARRTGLPLSVADIFRYPKLADITSSVTCEDVSPSTATIQHLDYAGPLQQSFAQGRLWFLEELYPGLNWYLVPIAVRIRGPLHLAALNAALLAIENRHETLRTTFASDGGVNLQVVQPFRAKQLNVIEVPSGDEYDCLEAVQRDQMTPFNLRTEPGWRVSVYQCNKDDHVLSIVMHHIVSDSWSVDILMRELSAFYSASLQGQDPLSQVQPLPIQYRNFSVWQRKQAQVEEQEKQLSYWLMQLQTSRPAELLSDKPRPATLSGKADTRTVHISGPVYARLQQFCKTHGVTLFVALLAVFRATHFRLTGQDDATIGTVNANRDRWELKDMIGFFVNMQCLRITVVDESFEELVQQVQAVVVASLANQDVPFESIVSKLKKDRDMSRHPLVQLAFLVHSQHDLGRLVLLDGVETESLEGPATSRFDLEFHFYQKPDGLQGDIIFSTDLYAPETIENMLLVFSNVLGRCLREPTVAITSLPLLTDTDYLQLDRMGLLQIEETAYPRDSSIVDVFHQQVSAHPARIAVKDSTQEMTYSQLDKASDNMAWWLQRRSLAPETLVGVFANRCCETIVAFLGIMKARLAYLPFDIKIPGKRMEAVLSSLPGQKIILLGNNVQPSDKELSNVEFIHITKALDEGANGRFGSLLGPLATSLAYVMFTSGSTGQPKGVMVEHRGVVRLVRDNNIVQHLPVGRVMAHVTNLAFDVSTWEIYVPLLNGGTLVCIDTMTALDPVAMLQTVRNYEITMAVLTPALFRQYTSESPAVVAALGLLCVGGEALHPRDFFAAERIMKGKLINCYGPTENTGISTSFVLTKEEKYTNGVPIGRALSNSGAYVMDPELQLVPLGVIGELVVTGDGVARGYTDPQRNISRFVSVKIAGKQVKAYRTGDYVRHRPTDGQLEFFGRMDGQVKIRGQRIELGEIEHVLRSHGSVADAITVLQHHNGKEAQLAGFVTMHEDTIISEQPGDSGSDSGSDEVHHVDTWEKQFDAEVYSPVSNIRPEKIGRDFIGWTSMYDGSEIDKTEMNEWLDDTIATMLNGHQPGHVLEIGSGTGMILFNLGDGLQSYIGLDPSRNAVDFIENTVKSIPLLADRVHMHKATAVDLIRLEGLNATNLVITNSVAQYFPSQDYLFKVVQELLALDSVQTLFFGDIRSYALYQEFLATRALHIAGNKTTKAELRRMMADMERVERELLIDPAFFTALPSRLPGLVEHVEILPKKMKATNELSCYRYAAVVHVKQNGRQQQDQKIRQVKDEEWIDFTKRGLDHKSLQQQLSALSSSSTLAVSNISYSKTIISRCLVESLDDVAAEKLGDQDWLSSVHEKAQRIPSFSATDLVELAQEAGCRIEISWSRQKSQHGGLDAIFHQCTSENGEDRVLFRFPTDHAERPLHSLSNKPLQQQDLQRTQQQLREMLQDQLPAYMVPQTITVLDSMPLNQNGKVDRNMLAQLVQEPTARQGPVQQPTSSTERKMQQLWARVLSIEPDSIGLDDSFFRLGGDSIAAMKLVGEARRMGLQLSVADIFRHPKLADLAGILTTQCSSASEEVPAYSLLGEDEDVMQVCKDVAAMCSVDASAINDVYPCSPLQEGLMSLTAKRAGDYIMQSVLELREDVDEDAFCAAWEHVVQSTAALRTRIVQHSELGLLQVVVEEKVQWVESESLEECLKKDKAVSMGLGDPLARYALVKEPYNGGKRWFVWTIHHALYDGWSLPRILHVVKQVYSGVALERQPSFNAFIQYLSQRNQKDATSYWQSALVDCKATLFPPLPSSVKQPVADTMVEYQCPPFTRCTTDMTMSTLIRAAWALVASRYTSSDDVVFGTTVTGRNAPVAGIEAMVGPTIATVPLRVHLQKDQVASTLLECLQQQATGMIAYEQTGLQHIAKMGPGPQHACGFQTLLVVQPAEDVLRSNDTLGEWCGRFKLQDFTTYALMVQCKLAAEGVHITASFDARVIEQWVVEKMLRQFSFIMQQLAEAGAEKTVSDIETTTPEDRQQLWLWNQEVPPAIERCVHDLFTEQAKARPGAPAVCAWDGEMTYGELDALSSKLAGHLVQLGVKAEDVVPLCFEKSMWTVVAMLAVLKAGGAFVPLDIDHPATRHKEIFMQTGARIVLASAQYSSQWISSSYHIVTVNKASTSQLPEVADNNSPRAEATDAAYIIFTSGSTGVPKGVVLEHKAVATSCLGHGQAFGITDYARVLQFASYTFDACIAEIITTLLCGGCICVPSDSDRRNSLAKAITTMDVNWTFLTPSVARLLTPTLVPSLKILAMGGEQVNSTDWDKWQSSVQVINGYGPTECCVFCVGYSSSKGGFRSGIIGKSVASVGWVVDPEDHNRLAPLGSIGELLVEGPILARGYLNDIDKTEAAFIDDPAWLLEGYEGHAGRRGRLYKTGDLVRYDSDGNLVCLGRKDSQVKVRGQRVELGEIEHHVRECLPEARQLAVEVILPSGQKEHALLAAFIQLGKGTQNALLEEKASGEDSMAQVVFLTRVEEELAKRLPEHMVPTILFTVKAMPITTSGKIDRKRLQDIGASFTVQQLAEMRTSSQGPKRQPSTEAEQMMQQLWAQVLRIEPDSIGLDDSFFRLGGDSIAAMKLVGEARRAGLQLGVADVFRHPKLAGITSSVTREDGSPSTATTIQHVNHSGPVQQSFSQGRLWFLEELYPGLNWYLMPFAVRIRGPLQLAALNSALLAIESRHETLRTTFASDGGVSVQVVQLFHAKQLHMIDLPLGDENSRLVALQQDQMTPFNLRTEPGWRVSVYRLSEDDHVLSIVMHHIVSDGWSVNVLMRELSTFYSASLRGQDPLSQIQPLPIQYRDFSVWQRQQAQIDEQEKQLSYWLTQLQTSRPAELLCDKPRPATLSGKADTRTVDISGPVYARLQQFCKAHGVTLFVALLAVFRATHFRLTGQDDATIGTVNANRDRWELKDMIGFFVNMQCLRITVADESFEELVQQVQAVAVASLANQDVPFESIVSKLKKDRDLSRHPVVQLAFVVHSQQNLGQLILEGLETESLEGPATSRFDLEFHFYQKPDGLQGDVVFSTDLYAPETIENMLLVFNNVLERCLQEPTMAITSLPLSTDADHVKLDQMGLIQIEETAYPRDSSIVDVFRQQVSACPSRIAVKDSLEEMTYAQLDEASDAIAKWLHKRSFAPESLVGVFANRCCQTIVALLGILKAGLACLPFDIKIPTKRIEAILSSLPGQKIIFLGADVQLPDIKFQVEFVRISKAIGEQVDELADGQPACHGPATTAEPSATSLAYVMFTSGSTGQPKGVMVEHRGVVRLVRDNNIVQHLPVSRVMAHVTNLAFDVSTWEIYVPLLNGGTLTVRNYEITMAVLTPALFRQYVLESPAVVAALGLLCVGGEALHPRDFFAAERIMKGKLINCYGPTENTGISTSFLIVTGDGVARGYTDTQRNIGRFVSVEIAGKKVKAYRTGDYVRHRPTDGQLEFFGRMDGQVKIRGQRIELGEIEHVLRSHRSVADAVTVLQHHNGKDTQLAGFVTIHKDAMINEQLGDGGSDGSGDEAHHVDTWEKQFDAEVYSPVSNIRPEKIGRDFTGWTSMYDGSEVDKIEMNEWLDDTIATILNGRRPGHVLEIGSGTGMILFNLGDGLQAYMGLDPSRNAVNFVEKTARSMPALAGRVRMHKATAADVGQLERPIAANLVVMNSVVQYFPSQDYLFKVVQELVVLEGVQNIFFGDIRSYALYQEFLATRALHIAGNKTTKAELRRMMADMERVERELLIDPAFFTALPSRLPGLVEHVEILPKKMKATNELSCYRYAAVVHVKQNGRQQQDQKIRQVKDEEWIDFTKRGLDHKSLQQQLSALSSSSTLAVSNISYSKTIISRCLVESLDDVAAEKLGDQDWLSSVHEKAQRIPSFSATDLVELAQEAGCRIEISWSRQKSQHGGLDAIFHQCTSENGEDRVLFRFPTDHAERPLHSLSNKPLQQQDLQRTQQQLREMLQDQLPAYMVPQTITVLDSMPLNQNGKVDRNMLAQLVQEPTARQGPVQQPTSAAERKMQQLWAQVLSIEPDSIGLDDSFFRLGGDSIAAMKLVGEARSTGLQLSVANIFRHPTLTALASLDTNQCDSTIEEILSFSLLGENADALQVCEEVAAICGIDASLIEDVYPCSPLQEGLMSLTAKRAGDYIMQSVLELRADVDEDALRAAWEDVVQSTAALRTRIVQHNELGLLQVVVKKNIQWTESEALEEYLKEDKAVSMGLGDPLARYALIKEAWGGKRWFVWTIHHALYDGWSLPRVLHAVKQVYSGAVLERQPSFNAFIQYLGQQDLEAAAAYWQTALADCEAVLFPPLPSTVTQPVADTTVKYQCPPSPEATSSNITTSTLIRAAWAIIASRYTTSDDVVFGTTVTGRNAPIPGVEAMVGPTIATVPVRVRVQGDQATCVFLKGLQDQATEMIVHEQTGLQRIAKMGQGPQHACSFQTLLVVQPADDVLDSDNTLGEWRSYSEMQEFTTYTLTVQCMLAAEGVQITASFDTRVIEQWVVEKMLRQFGFIMQQLAEAGVEKKVADIEITTPEDRQQLWVWNQNVPPAVERCIHDLFTEQAAARPDAPAICAWDGELTYGELDALSSKLAGHLVQLGVKAEDVVPLCFEKSMWTVVAMLAVLKAGGAFLLLDPSLPTERLAVMCRKLGSVHALASEACLLAMTDLVREAVVVVDRKSLLQMPTPDRELPSTLSTSTAYVIFTSGSTGEPKGCKIEHRSSCTAIVQHGSSVQMSTSTRALQFGSYSFAGALAEILYSLIHGGCVCVPSEEERRVGLASAMSRMAVNWAFLTPTVVDGIGELEAVPSLATLCIGGESIRNSQIEKWGDHVHLRQTYGSSETSGYVSSVRLTSGSTARNVGKGSTAVYWIVNAENQNQLAPLGATGELLVEGAILGREYTDEAEKTAATFIEAPVWRSSFDKSYSRLYKTGDLARYTKDGSIELLGRKDTQVKLRGQRIELEEIEHQARLSAAVGVKGLAVELIRPKDKDNMLVCFMAIENKTGGQEETGDEAWSAAYAQAAAQTVRDRLERFLPQYMVPALFVPLAQLPTTSSQKVDRKRLREMGASFTAQQLAEMRTSSQGPKRQPSTEAEQTMQQLWAQVLNIERDSIGLDDSFFRLGGDSIAAMKLVGEAHRIGLQLSVADIFRHHTLAALAYMYTGQHSRALEEIPAFSLISSHVKDAIFSVTEPFGHSVLMDKVIDVLPASCMQERYISQGVRAPRGAFNYFFMDSSAAIDVQVLKASCSILLDSFPVLRTHFLYFQGKLYQVVPRYQELPFSIFEVNGPLAEESQAIHMRDLDHITPLGLPTSFMLVRTTAGMNRLIIRLSHAQYDGVCLPVMLRTLATIYQQEPMHPTTGFNNFLAYVSSRHSLSVHYWRNLLEGSHITNITSKLSPKAREDTAIRPVMVERVMHTPQLPAGLTMASLVSSAWAVVLSHISGEEDVVYGLVVAGRNSNLPGITDVMGPCSNFIPVRARPYSTRTSEELLQSVQDQYASLGESDSMGLDDIVQHCTDWPAKSEFDSIVQHQNIEEQPEIQFAGETTKLQWFENPFAVPRQLFVFSRPRGNSLTITINGNTGILTDQCAEKLLVMLCDTISQLSDSLDTPLAACKLLLPTCT
ncbi:Nonribosomal peptide synthetase 3 [Pyrenophora teres f. teres]|uniref:Nonribosomal peptide synthetase 3 n=2 Tax=Pyrenophora teres f. teres TaxID=97479 RepID=A0A6S6VLB9_9PLEO|nr:Nonribosomal peptide synthetase 3 [Pyrenophora teres f. teres]